MIPGPLLLSVKRGRFRHDDPEADHADRVFRAVVPEVLARDDYRCHYCSLQAKKYQEVHHRNDDHRDNRPENLLTVCALCHAVCHLGFAARRNAGTLIYLPPELGITQAEVNALVRTLWIMERTGDRDMSMASLGYQSRLNRLVINARRHYDTADPSLIADFLLNLSDEDYQRRDVLFAGLYFLPAADAFSRQLAYWEKEVYRNVKASSWVDIAEDKARRWLLSGDQSEYALAQALQAI